MEPKKCRQCGTELVVGENKRGGFFATCPNKPNHATGKQADPPLAKTPPIAAKKDDEAAPIVPKPSGKTVFGW